MSIYTFFLYNVLFEVSFCLGPLYRWMCPRSKILSLYYGTQWNVFMPKELYIHYYISELCYANSYRK